MFFLFVLHNLFLFGRSVSMVVVEVEVVVEVKVSKSDGNSSGRNYSNKSSTCSRSWAGDGI